ncbi:MAG: ImmA/IrrE family metallo-endopeptidase [Acidimicrobiales bacterium]
MNGSDNPETSEVLVDRLRAARRGAGLTQAEAAERLGIARTTLVAIEKGERQVRPEELVNLASIYGRPLNELLRTAPAPADFVSAFRLAPERIETADTVAAVRQLESLADDYVELERLTSATQVRRYPAVATIDGVSPREAGESLASGERNRLGLGDEPLLGLRDLLEDDVGMRIFALALPSKIVGLFIWSTTHGPCVGINAAHPLERQRWSLAHEYAHFLAQRTHTEVTLLQSYQRTPATERFADAFAEHFLMPASGLKRRFQEIRLSRPHGITPADLLNLADRYLVSAESMGRRLRNLGLIRPGTWEHLVDSGFRVREAQKLLDIDTLQPDAKMFPTRYRHFAVTAYLQGEITEGELAHFLRSDRASVRGLVRNLSHRIALDEDGVTRDVELEPLAPLDMASG